VFHDSESGETSLQTVQNMGYDVKIGPIDANGQVTFILRDTALDLIQLIKMEIDTKDENKEFWMDHYKTISVKSSAITDSYNNLIVIGAH
jgi:hypothetical protein